VSLQPHLKTDAGSSARLLLHHRSFLFCCVLGLLVAGLLPDTYLASTRILLGWNAVALSFVATFAVMVARAPHCILRQYYATHYEGSFGIVAMLLVVTAASLGAVLVELSLIKQMNGILGPFHLVLTALTVVIGWSFIQLVFALRYANLYFNASRKEALKHGGLDIPGADGQPGLVDFLYFSVIIGTCCSTSDINVTSSIIRREVLMHGVFSFFFNIIVIGLTINMIASVF
jgi:uncharacterized membrane protein